MYNIASFIENSMECPQKIRTAVWSNNPTRVYFHKKLKARYWINSGHMYGHCCIIPKGQEVYLPMFIGG